MKLVRGKQVLKNISIGLFVAFGVVATAVVAVAEEASVVSSRTAAVAADFGMGVGNLEVEQMCLIMDAGPGNGDVVERLLGPGSDLERRFGPLWRYSPNSCNYTPCGDDPTCKNIGCSGCGDNSTCF